MTIYKKVEIVEETKLPKIVNNILAYGFVVLLVISFISKSTELAFKIISSVALIFGGVYLLYGKKPKKVRTDWIPVENPDDYKVEE